MGWPGLRIDSSGLSVLESGSAVWVVIPTERGLVWRQAGAAQTSCYKAS